MYNVHYYYIFFSCSSLVYNNNEDSLMLGNDYYKAFSQNVGMQILLLYLAIHRTLSCPQGIIIYTSSLILNLHNYIVLTSWGYVQDNKSYNSPW